MNKETETGRYIPFCQLFNLGLKMLESSANDRLRYRDALQILFHVNDPKLLDGNSVHKFLPAHRKPDVALVSLAAASRAAKFDEFWDDIVANVATSPPKEAFHISNIRSAYEFKCTSKTVDDPPSSYAGLSLNTWEPIHDIYAHGAPRMRPMTEGPFGTNGGKKQKTRRSGTPQTSSSYFYCSHSCLYPYCIGTPTTNSQESGLHRRVRKSAMAKAEEMDERKLHETEREESRKRNSESMGSAKGDTGQSLPPVVQCGLYGTDMLSHAPWVTHAINILVIGSAVISQDYEATVD